MLTCMIVEDSDVVRRIARQFAERQGFLVVEAEDGIKALELCRQGLPDVIVLDWHIPNLSAHDFLSTLRSRGDGARPHIIYMTTENDEADISRAFALGADTYMMKPFDRDALDAKLVEAKRAA